jgi:hypothetical protein
VDTPATAPPIATSTTPPATTLKSKFLREAETPGWAASAISGTTAAASKAKPVSPAMFCSFCEALLIQHKRSDFLNPWWVHKDSRLDKIDINIQEIGFAQISHFTCRLPLGEQEAPFPDRNKVFGSLER